MRHTVALAAILAVALTACSHSRADLKNPKTQDDFGVQMAKMNLWREAMFRFERAVQINPNDALAHNNLAVAYEANGDYEKAAREYREALKLDRTNQYIQKNYSRYTEFMARNRKRQQRQEAKSASGSASDTTAAAPATTTKAAPSPATTTSTDSAATPPAATTTAPPPAQNPPAANPPAQNPPPATPPAAPPSNPPGASR